MRRVPIAQIGGANEGLSIVASGTDPETVCDAILENLGPILIKHDDAVQATFVISNHDGT